jgi:hypothetical protein
MQKSIGYLTISLFLLSPRLVNAQSPAYEPRSNPSDTFIAPHFSTRGHGRALERNGLGNWKERIDDPYDHVRLELELALARNIPVIPVLVRNCSIPAADKLPGSLQSLAYRNGINVRPDPDFHGDIDRLIKGIGSHLT